MSGNRGGAVSQRTMGCPSSPPGQPWNTARPDESRYSRISRFNVSRFKSTLLPQSYANTRISEGPARSRADGVTIALGPIYILRFSRMAARTSYSQTKSTGFGAGGAGGWGAGPMGHPAALGHSAASQPYPPAAFPEDGPPPRRARKRSTTSADTLGAAGLADSQEHEGPPGAFAGAAAATATPREAR